MIKIHSYNVKEIPVLNPPIVHTQDIFTDIICSLFDLPFCWVTSYVEPIIDPITHAASIDNTDIYLLSGYMTGNIKTLVDNSYSREGYSYEENTSTGETRNQQTIADSATIDHDGIATHVISAMNEQLAKVENTVSGLAAGNSINVTATFKKEGYYEMLRNIYNYFTRRTVNMDSSIDVTVTYQWFGTQTKKFHIDSNIDAPVTKVTWHMW